MSASAVATRSRASTTFSSSPEPIRATASETTDSQAAPLMAPSAKVTLRGAGGAACGSRSGIPASSSWPMTVTHERPRLRADHHARHHEDAVAGVVGEAEAAEADQAGAGDLHLVADHRCAGHLLPPVGGVGEPVGSRRRGSGPRHPTRPCPRRDAARPWAPRPGAGRAGSRGGRRGRPPRPCGPRVDRRARRCWREGWSRVMSLRGDGCHSAGRIRGPGHDQ